VSSEALLLPSLHVSDRLLGAQLMLNRLRVSECYHHNILREVLGHLNRVLDVLSRLDLGSLPTGQRSIKAARGGSWEASLPQSWAVQEQLIPGNLLADDE
jgi:hypothetical protein